MSVDHSLQSPNLVLSMQTAIAVGTVSRQPNPNNPRDLQDVAVELGDVYVPVGVGVIMWVVGLDVKAEVWSLQPHICPGVWQLVDICRFVDVAVASISEVVVVVVIDVFDFLSLQPNQPGVLHVDVVVVVFVEVIVTVLVTIASVVEVGSSVSVVVSVVVVWSRHPHQPGVLHVFVRLVVVKEDVEVEMRVVLVVKLVFTNFHAAQSRHSLSTVHSGVVL